MSEAAALEAGSGSRPEPAERDLEQAITALKKGAQLLKYGRRGKPKFCSFRISNDESTLIWLTGNDERKLKLSHVLRIIPGQHTAIFQRYPRPEKECHSFSLIYDDRSLDIICKDKEESEVWFAGLKALVQRSHQKKLRVESRNDILSSGAASPRTFTRRSSPLSSPFSSNGSMQKDISDNFRLRSPYSSPPKLGLNTSDVMAYDAPPKGSDSTCASFQSTSSGHSDNTNGHRRSIPSDAFRVSLSSVVSSSSHGSGHDDGDALGDVFIWGEGTGEGLLGGGTLTSRSASVVAMDSLMPKALEFAVRLDVQTVSCGARHAMLVTKHGEIYSWGEESGGKLGHGVDVDLSQPKLIDALAHSNIELVACGEYHTCAVTLSGELYMWGNGASNLGTLGYGSQYICWVPKKVEGPLEGVHVSSISCGPWHTAVVTSAGQLFTFGEGSFGVLGHGDCESAMIPREVESLKGMRTIRAACGVWHTAAVAEVMVGNSSSCPAKVFTWGDGQKGFLGHGDRDRRLVPTCVAALVETNFSKVSCGHTMTVALTTSGQVYIIGSPFSGQPGNTQAEDDLLPIRVQGKLLKTFVEEISCGAYHVAVLTSRNEVYTWGKGSNGQLGHGDTCDRNLPTLVEALKDKQVRSVVCGTNFTAAICIHKWVSGMDQSMCSSCRLLFNFKRKRHNCYNCALVFCNSCSSKRAFKASLAPNPKKQYRVCDSCYSKLNKSSQLDMCSGMNDRNVVVLAASDNMGEEGETRSKFQISRLSLMESFKQEEGRFSKAKKKFDFNGIRVSPVPTGSSHGSGFSISKSFNPMVGTTRKFFSASVPASRIASRTTSPKSRRASPTRPITPMPALGSLSTPRAVDVPKVTNGSIGQVLSLRSQVDNLTRKTQLLEVELDRTTKQLKEAIALAGEETAKSRAAKEVIMSLTAQLTSMAERLSVGGTKNSKLPPLNRSSISSDISAMVESLAGSVHSSDADSNSFCSLNVYNGQSPAKIKATDSEAVANGAQTSDAAARYESELVEQDEPGVYITLNTLPGGARDLKRVRFSRKRFSEKQAEKWWAENRARVYEQYNVRTVERSSSSISNDQ